MQQEIYKLLIKKFIKIIERGIMKPPVHIQGEHVSQIFVTPKMLIYYTYVTMMKLMKVIPSLKKIQKYINHVRCSLSSADLSVFQKLFVTSRNKDKKSILKHNFVILLIIIKFVKGPLFNVITILIMSPKLATLGLL